MNQAVQDAINEQIKNELYSGYAYLSMAAHFDQKSFEGFSHWMRLQAQEELGHAMRLYDYLLERGARVVLEAIEKPQTDWGTPLEIFEHALKHEQEVTKMIGELYELAGQKGDHATAVELQWFVTEQVEEEASAELAVNQLRMAENNPAALIMLDQRFGGRSSAE